MKNKILFLIIVLLPALSFSQEVLTGLSTNVLIKANFKKQKVSHSKTLLKLPFFDDFSGTDIFPNDTLWTDRNVFINSSYPDSAVTIGVATFDALNDTGALYSTADAYGFGADTLTSNQIRLDAYYESGLWTDLKKSDSVYFSFYYQPQGIGNAPETDDSLVLEFYSPDTAVWKPVWSAQGMTLVQFHSMYHVWFKQVMIPITDSASYFQSGFKFRFINYASLANNTLPTWAGNVDQWHIDYVYLNKGRNMGDSIYKDIAFSEPAPSALKNYYSMPWSQFNVDPSGEIKSSFAMSIFNLDTVTYNTSYEYNVNEIDGAWSYTHPGGSANLLPLSHQSYAAHANPPVDFSFPSVSADSVSFLFTHIIKEGIGGDSHRKNDTTTFEQKFYNYYAYDDGEPEAGYGLVSAGAKLAYKFTLNHPDTLRAVNMFFNQTLNNASQQFFKLTVWDEANGHPNNILYQTNSIKPQYEDSLNQYHRYRIEDTTLVLSGTFYVGWVQIVDVFLNIGFDRNNDQQSKISYDVGSGWLNSSFQGALMIRPVLGKELPLVAGIHETAQSTGELKVFPNPSAGNNITLILPDDAKHDISDLRIRMFDMIGNEVCNYPYRNNIDISNLQNGIYLLVVSSDKTDRTYMTKLSIIK